MKAQGRVGLLAVYVLSIVQQNESEAHTPQCLRICRSRKRPAVLSEHPLNTSLTNQDESVYSFGIVVARAILKGHVPLLKLCPNATRGSSRNRYYED